MVFNNGFCLVCGEFMVIFDSDDVLILGVFVIFVVVWESIFVIEWYRFLGVWAFCIDVDG